MQLTGAQALVRSLEQQGVEVVFGLPGGAILPAYDPLRSSSLRHVLVRHEQGAGHAAEGYAWATGRTGVCLVTSGPGATNLVTALADAYGLGPGRLPITSRFPHRDDRLRLLFQEADITGITLPVTKHNELVTSAERLPAAIAEAFHIASTGRPGPVLVDVPKDILQATMTWGPGTWPPAMNLPGYRLPAAPDQAAVRAAAALLRQARRPVLYVGGGVIKAGAHAELLALAELAQAPVTTTLMARGAFPDPHPLALGMPGMHGCYTAVAALQEADLVVALGARFDDRVTGNLATFAPHAKIVHADIDPAEIGKNRVPDVPIPGDVRATLAGLGESMAALIAENGPPDTGYWLRCIGDWKRRFPLRYTQDADGPLKPQHVVERLSALTGGEAVVVAGVGQHQMHAAQHYSFTTPRSWINSGGLGTMGFAVPAAMGAQVGRPGELVVAIDGDGCFQMTAQELATCAIEHLPIKVLIFNNGFLGMVRQWQELFYEERYSEVELGTAIPDYVKLAEAYGCHGLRCDRADDVDAVLDKALATTDVPTVVDFRVHDREGVFPMVPAGRPNDEIVLGPEFTGDEQRAATRRELRGEPTKNTEVLAR